MIFQGTTPSLKVIVDGFFPWDDIEALELAVAAEGGTKIILSKDDVSYSEEEVIPTEGEPHVVKALYISLSQRQTFALRGTTAAQLRFLTNNGVYASNIAPFVVCGSISNQILGDDKITSLAGVIRRAEIEIASDPLPVHVTIQEAGGSGAPFNDMLELAPNNAVSESIEIGVTKKLHLYEWITDILTTKKAPIITLSQKTATLIQGDPYTAGYLSVACNIAEGTGIVNEVTVDGVALSPVALSFNVTYPSANIIAGSISANKTIQVTAKADDGKEATPQSLSISFVYKVGVTVEGGTTREVNYGSGTVTADNRKWIYISVPTSKGEVKLETGGFTYVADNTSSETRHNLPYTVYAFKHETIAAATYNIKYS